MKGVVVDRCGQRCALGHSLSIEIWLCLSAWHAGVSGVEEGEVAVGGKCGEALLLTHP